MARADRNIAWVEKYLKIPDGPKRGQPFLLASWQKKLMYDIYDNEVQTRLAILSFARKNGKSAFASALLMLHFIGPEAIAGSQLYSAARSRDQAALIFGYASKMIRQSPVLSKVTKVVPSRKELRCQELDSMFRSLSSDATTAFGLNPAFVIHDELGQVKGPIDPLYDSIETAMAAQDRPLSIVISTQAATDDDLLSTLIDDAKANSDPSTICSVYSADDIREPMSLDGLKAANPGMGEFMSEIELYRQMEKARRLPSAAITFKNLHLNMRCSTDMDFITREEWDACKGTVPPIEDCDALYGGLDLSRSRDLTAFVIVGVIGRTFYIYPTFWLPRKGLEERSASARIPYIIWREKGFLQATPGTLVDPLIAAEHIYELYMTQGIQRIAYDSWGYQSFIRPLTDAGFADYLVDPHEGDKEELLFEVFGQGYKSMSPALKTAERLIIDRRVVHDGNPIMNMCLDNCVVTMDPAGNRKLDKSKAKRSIDGAIALIMALSIADREVGEPTDPNFKIESLFAEA